MFSQFGSRSFFGGKQHSRPTFEANYYFKLIVQNNSYIIPACVHYKPQCCPDTFWFIVVCILDLWCPLHAKCPLQAQNVHNSTPSLPSVSRQLLNVFGHHQIHLGGQTGKKRRKESVSTFVLPAFRILG